MDSSNLAENIAGNARPYGIFFSYLGVCLTVAIFIIIKLFEKTEKLYMSAPTQLPPKRHVIMFTILATCSLLSTWGFMIQYFQWSYDNWLKVRSQHDLDPSVKHWGLWLQETSLFKEAWESVIVGHSRYWWSHQIFFFACALGLHLEWKGVRRGISYTWAFMLLGQIVAISFATNLFLLTLLLSPPQQQPPVPTSKVHKWLSPWLIDGLAVITTVASAEFLAREKFWYHKTVFMPLLLAPHVALLVLPSARAILPARLFRAGDASNVDKIYSTLWLLTCSSGVQLLLKTYNATGKLETIRNTLLEHPAVSSVGFDVIFCWITWICWWSVQIESKDYISQAFYSETSVQKTKDKFDVSRKEAAKAG